MLCFYHEGLLDKAREVREAEDLWAEIKVQGLEPDVVAYNTMIGGLYIDSAMLIYRDMCRKDFRPQRLTVELLIRGICDKGMVLKAFEIMKAVREFGVCPTGTSYELLVKGLCAEGKIEEALKLQAEMVGKGFKPNLEIYNSFIDGYLRQGNEEMVAMLRKEVLETQKGEN
ncbi:Cysteine/Histidine-rich C1 domain family protein [Hibiscus syriacus]|uniref:Cysteine/Histidine-rich C1 domain family protein n=1 Tax=Hibiscus syriacus TaxID=106335 RepID=A0A6A3CB65_HIBSY|nr:Cysteine/Histidine-rich C1 domain family protein [Hibiscus syriacus]